MEKGYVNYKHPNGTPDLFNYIWFSAMIGKQNVLNEESYSALPEWKRGLIHTPSLKGATIQENGSFFKELEDVSSHVVFPASEALGVPFPGLPKGTIRGKLMIPVDFDSKAEPYLIEIPPKKNLPSHFFIHKGEEVGYLLSGKLQLKLEKETYSVQKGDVVYLTSEMPSQWKNTGSSVAKLLWLKMK